MTDREVTTSILSRLGDTSRETLRTFTAKLPIVNPMLIGREQELAFLDRAWAEPATNFVQVIAAGGTGKTALVDKWFRRHLGEADVFGWSFYSQGTLADRQTSSDPFFVDILPWLNIEIEPTASIYTKAEAVAHRLRKERVLLLLEGVEPLQDATGALRDAALKALLQELDTANRGLVVCTTRVRLDIPDDAPRAVSIDLDNRTTSRTCQQRERSRQGRIIVQQVWDARAREMGQVTDGTCPTFCCDCAMKPPPGLLQGPLPGLNEPHPAIEVDDAVTWIITHPEVAHDVDLQRIGLPIRESKRRARAIREQPLVGKQHVCARAGRVAPDALVAEVVHGVDPVASEAGMIDAKCGTSHLRRGTTGGTGRRVANHSESVLSRDVQIATDERERGDAIPELRLPDHHHRQLLARRIAHAAYVDPNDVSRSDVKLPISKPPGGEPAGQALTRRCKGSPWRGAGLRGRLEHRERVLAQRIADLIIGWLT